MCVILTCRKLPSKITLQAAAKQNDHGAGLAIALNGEVYYYKSIDLIQLEEFRKVNAPMMLHFRLATVGDKVPELCQPFPITDDVELNLHGKVQPSKFFPNGAAFAHNGTIREWNRLMIQSIHGSGDKVPDGSHWSDSRALAWLVARHGPSYLRILDDKSRFCILTGEGKFMHFGEWHSVKEEEGVWASNLTWVHRTKSYESSSSNWTGSNHQHPHTGVYHHNATQEKEEEEKEKKEEGQGQIINLPSSKRGKGATYTNELINRIHGLIDSEERKSLQEEEELGAMGQYIGSYKHSQKLHSQPDSMFGFYGGCC